MTAALAPLAAGLVVLAVAVATDGPRRAHLARRRLAPFAAAVDAAGTSRAMTTTPTVGSATGGTPRVPGWVRAALVGAAVPEPDRQLLRWLGAVPMAVVVGVAVPALRLPAALVVVAPPALVVTRRGRAERRRRDQLPEAVDAVAAGLRGGLGLLAALDGAARLGPPVGDELARVATTARAGRPLARVLADWGLTHDDAATGLAVAALIVAADVGGPGARALDGAAASLRDRAAAEAEAGALATQGTVSALVLTVAPVAFAVLLSSLDPRAGRFLLGTPAGWLCIAIGAGLDLLGALWMGRLVRGAR